MKKFEYAKERALNKKAKFKMPTIKTANYEIPLWGLLVLPLVIIAIVYDKIKDWNYLRQEWSEEKATKVLNCFLPYSLEFIEEDNAYYYCLGWHNSGDKLAKRAPINLKRWAKKFGYKTFQYLEEKYENPDFIKTIENDGYDKWIKFEKRGTNNQFPFFQALFLDVLHLEIFFLKTIDFSRAIGYNQVYSKRRKKYVC